MPWVFEDSFPEALEEDAEFAEAVRIARGDPSQQGPE